MYFWFQAAGRSPTASAPLSKSCSSSKRTMMCRLYVASSACTRIKDGATWLTAAWKASSVTSWSAS